jgi:hypothetical protein
MGYTADHQFNHVLPHVIPLAGISFKSKIRSVSTPLDKHCSSLTYPLRTMQIFVRDGTLYFLVIFAANLLNTLIYFVRLHVTNNRIPSHLIPQLAVEDLKAIGASFSQLITATMISRLVLNLRSAGEDRIPGYQNIHVTTRIMDRTIGNLGEELEGAFDMSGGSVSSHRRGVDSGYGSEQFDMYNTNRSINRT